MSAHQHIEVQMGIAVVCVCNASVPSCVPFDLYGTVIPYDCLPASAQVMVWNTVNLYLFFFFNLGLLRAGLNDTILIDLDTVIPVTDRVTVSIQFSSVIFFSPFQRTSGTGNLTEWAARMWWRHSRSATRNFSKPGNDWEDP